MRLLERKHKNEPTWLWKLGNWTTVPLEWVRTVAWVSGFNLFPDEWTWEPVTTLFQPDPKTGHVPPLFWNGALFLRLVWPLGIFVQIRWSGSTTKKSHAQFGLGWKVNGRFGLIARIRSDVDATQGAWSGIAGENDSTPGWNWGPK